MSYFGNSVFPNPLVNPADIVTVTTSTALSENSYGKTFLLTATGALTIVLMPLLAGSITKRIVLVNDSVTGIATVNASGIDKIRTVGVSVSSFTLVSGDSVTLENNGVTWSVVQNSSARSGGVAGTVSNAKMSIQAASASATFTADEVIVETSSGVSLRLVGLNLNINLAAVGAGGSDIGTAPTSGFVAVYVIYNSSTNTASLLATNATSSFASNIYGGANMPAGYSASALISVWRTDSSKRFVIGEQRGKTIAIEEIGVLTATAPVTAITLLPLAPVVPINALEINGTISSSASTPASVTTIVSSTISSTGVGRQSCLYSVNSAGGVTNSFTLVLATPQTLFYQLLAPSNTGQQFGITISQYKF